MQHVEEIILENESLMKKTNKTELFEIIQNYTSKILPPSQNIEIQNKEEIKKENEELKKKIFCKHCKKEKSNKLILPCQHLSLCNKCFFLVEKCPTCKSNIKQVINVILS